MALVAMGFMRFMSNATRAQGNLTKTGEASALDMAMRSLLQNNKACTETVKGLTLTTLSPTLQPLTIKDPGGNAALTQGTNSNGVLIEKLEAEAFPPDRGVQAVRLHSVYTKVGDTAGGRKSYEHDYYVNVTFDASGNVDRCFEKESQGELQIVAIDDFGVLTGPGTPAPRLLAIFCNGAVRDFPADWGRQLDAPSTCTDCVMPNCPHVDGPPVTLQAKGNLLAVNLIGHASVFAKPPQTAPPIPAIGAIVQIIVDGPEGTRTLTLGNESRGSDEIGFSGGTHMTSPTPIPVTLGATYTLKLRVAVNGGDPAVKAVAAGAAPRGAVIHYLQSGT